MNLSNSELILNPNGSIYHINLLPEHICENIILVGDPNRVPMVSKYFDTIEVKISKREIVTHIGRLNYKKIMVLSTGMGTDNIDIVLNELDALANINFKTKTLYKERKSLNIIRIGTSGTIQKDIPIGSFIISKNAIGLDGLLYYYESSDQVRNMEFEKSFTTQINLPKNAAKPYVIACSNELLSKFSESAFIYGNTLTMHGFYAPQGRNLRLPLSQPNFIKELAQFSYNNQRITNIEMETSGIYGLSKLMKHNALSFNCILANRVTGEFVKDGKKKIEELIQLVLGEL